MARVTVRYRPDRREFGKLMRSQQMRRPVIRAANDIRDRAVQIAPHDTGDYAAAFRVNEQAGLVSVRGNPRVNVEVYNDDPAAAPLEFGNGRIEARRVMLRAGEMMGEVPE